LTASSKQALYLNLVFKSLKSDTNIPRIKSFIKRIVHITSIHSPGFTCGVLFLLSELVSSRPELKSLWSTDPKPETQGPMAPYDPRKRDPQFANAENTTLWELSPLLSHYHPAVQLYAENLLSRRPNATKPDLALHTVKHFLDRFIYRNPKSKNLMRGTSIMQPLPGPNASLVLNVRGNAQTEVAVNSEDWWRQHAEKIRPEEVFFHRYFVAKEQDEVRRAGKKRKRGDEEGSEMDEDEIFEALVKSSKEEGGFGDEDVDIDGTDEEVEWSDEELDQDEDLDEDLDEEMLEKMNFEMSDPEISEEEGLDEDIEEENVSEEEGDIDAFFDDEAEEVDDESEEEEEEEEEWQGVSDKEAEGFESASESGDAENVDGRFDFGDDESDMVGSDEDVPVVQSSRGETAKADRSKKRKLKNLPTFASVEEYAHLLED
jgi:ribosome biogenesis protein MAK21